MKVKERKNKMKLILTIVGAIILCFRTYSTDILKNLSSDNENEYLNSALQLEKEWKDSKFENIGNLDSILRFCIKKVEAFNWNKYLRLSQQQLKELPLGETKEINKIIYFMELIAKGYICNNQIAQKYKKEAKLKRIELMFNNLIQKANDEYNAAQSKKMLQKKYIDKLAHFKWCISNISGNVDTSSINYRFLKGISNDRVFLSQLKKDNSTKDKILLQLRNNMFKTKHNEYALDTYVSLFCALTNPQETILLLDGLLTAPHISAQEKETLTHKKNTILKYELN